MVFMAPFLLLGISKSISGILIIQCSDLTISLDKSSIFKTFKDNLIPYSYIYPPIVI
jgi:hypothetical protein